MNVEKHECSLLEVFSDVGSTPTASTIFLFNIYFFRWHRSGVFQGVFEKNACFVMVFCGVFVVKLWCVCGSERHTLRP